MNRLVEVIKSVEDDMNERDFVNFWSSYKLLIEQLKSKGRKNAHYDLINYLELCNDHGINLGKIERIGIPDEFAKHYGSQNSLLDKWNIEKNKIYLRIKTLLQDAR